MSFNHSAPNCTKSLLIICSKADKVTTKQCSDTIQISLSWWKVFQYYSFVIHWLFNLLTWHTIPLMFTLSYTFFAFTLHKVSTLASKQLSANHCSNIIDLLCTAEKQRGYKAWSEDWRELTFKSIWSLI